ncbi:hypothetical protein OIO90_002067 [Microbotryomycetes sp. JL221]|nr:hypothetical protein OIO90_002067 [Microbotryomycetes sp. JL221]
MNVHHQKSSYTHSVPQVPRRVVSAAVPSSSVGSLNGHVDLAAQAPRLVSGIERVPFAWQLDLVVPAIEYVRQQRLPVELESLVADMSPFYVCKNVNLADLLEPTFMNDYIRTGRLFLNVCKDTYEQLGLAGRRSAHGTLGQRFNPSMRSGKKGFERIKIALRNWPRQNQLSMWNEIAGIAQQQDNLGRTFDMLFAFVDNRGAPQPVQFPPSISSSKQTPALSLRLSGNNIRVPKTLTEFNNEQLSDRPTKRSRSDKASMLTEEFGEWLGLVSCNAIHQLKWDDEFDDNDVQIQWGVAQEECGRGSVTFASWVGFFHPKTLSTIVSTMIESLVKPTARSTPFISVACHSPPHSPLSHLSKANPPVVNTSKKPTGRKRLRGRGRGEDEESRDLPAQVGHQSWHLVIDNTRDKLVWTLVDTP